MVMIIITCKNLNDHLLIVPYAAVGIASCAMKFGIDPSRRLGPKPHAIVNTYLYWCPAIPPVFLNPVLESNCTFPHGITSQHIDFIPLVCYLELCLNGVQISSCQTRVPPLLLRPVG